MNIFFEEHIKLIADMLAEDVQFILVGGYAVNYHGYNRTTGDMDIWLKPDNENKIKVIAALKKNDIDPEDLRQIHTLDFTHTLVFSAWDNPYKVDFLTHISGVTYEKADAEKIVAEIEGLSIPIIHLDHLVLSKITTGRIQDMNDIEKLQQVQRKRK
jgi:predicted nucleotidyltransferase